MADPLIMNDELLYEHHGTTGVITFNRPQARNALTFEMYEALAEICNNIIEKNEDTRSLIITGAGEKAFAAGTDISRFKDFRTAEDAIGYELSLIHI